MRLKPSALCKNDLLQQMKIPRLNFPSLEQFLFDPDGQKYATKGRNEPQPGKAAAFLSLWRHSQRIQNEKQ